MPGEMNKAGSTKGLTFFAATMNKIFRQTLAPKLGDATFVRGYERDLLLCMVKGEEFLASDYIFQTMKNASANHTRSLPYAPYIMVTIERMIPQTVRTEVEHNAFRPALEKPTPQPAPAVDIAQGQEQATAGRSKKRKLSEAKKLAEGINKRKEDI